MLGAGAAAAAAADDEVDVDVDVDADKSVVSMDEKVRNTVYQLNCKLNWTLDVRCVMVFLLFVVFTATHK